MGKPQRNDAQLSLFETYNDEDFAPPPSQPVSQKKPTVLDFVRARFENGPDMTQEEYKRWIKIIIQNSLRSME